MRRHVSKMLALSLILAGACGGTMQPGALPPGADRPPAAASPAAPAAGLQIKLTTVYVDDQERALRFYTDVLGLVVKDDVSSGGYRWLTVTAPGDVDGTALLLALDSDPAAKAYQEAMFAQGQPAIMFFTDDIHGDHERIQTRGGAFTMSPTEVMAGSVIATLADTCGNLIQITELAR